ncbi:MAG: pentapeptide repeat-containing protein, partial [Planctomycetaceae bacterium]|nr:pentapeptide repeat-containing protein [Planctomycetaceae bacterium]
TFGRVTGARFDGCRGFVTIQEARDCSFRKSNFERHADKRGSRLSAVHSNLDGCRLSDVIAGDLSDCSLRRADMSEVTLEQGNLTRSNLAGASLVEAGAGYIRAEEANFSRTDCTRADLMCSIFERASFHKANLTGAVLHNAIFEEADLRGACLREADLRWAKLQNADLTGADLTGARLEDADFTGAKLSRAKLADADLSNAILSEAQIASTTGQVLKEPASGAGGTKIAELEQVAQGSRELEVSIDVTAGRKSARLTVEASSLWGGSVSGREDLYHEEWEPTSFAGEPTFSGCLLWLRNRWPKGQPDLASLKVVAKRCPRQGEELRFLAAAAWCEAFGLPELSPEDFAAINDAVKAAASRLREIQIAELRGGPAGIQSWNARSYEDRVDPGEFRRVDFSGRKMSRVNLEGVDLQGANLTGATLNFASLSCRDLKRAVFDEVRARSANFHATKLAGASFIRAGLQHARFRMSSLLRVNFQEADLRRADFLDADIKGADFTGANLTDAVFDGTKFNELTMFPAGFQLPSGLVWKGNGPDPRSK